MSTAFIITGQMRTFGRLHKNQHWQVFRHFEGPHFFVSVANDEQAKDAELYKQYGKTFIEYVDQPEHIPLPDGCPPEESWVDGRNFMHEPYSISVSPQAVLKQLWAMNQGWQWFLKNRGDTQFKTFVRIRPDLHFFYFENLGLTGNMARTPWWGRFGGVNDRFALLAPAVAEHYFTTFTHIPRMIQGGAPLHPESLIRESIRESGATLWDDLPVSFATVRLNGELRMPEISADDMAHGMQ